MLDRSLFRKTIPTSAAIVHTPSRMSAIKKACENNMIQFKGTIPVKVERSPEGALHYIQITKEMNREMKADMGGHDGEKLNDIKKLIVLHPRIKHDGGHYDMYFWKGICWILILRRFVNNTVRFTDSH